MVAHVYQQIPILQKYPVFVYKDILAPTVDKLQMVAYVQVIHVNHVVIVHYHRRIHRIHVFVSVITQEFNVNEVKPIVIHLLLIVLLSVDNPCVSSPCLNQAVCQSHWNTTNTWYTCQCVGTYTGTRCETSLLNPCGGLCMNE